MLTEVYAVVRKSDGKPAYDRALYLTATRAKIAMRGGSEHLYRIVRISGVVTPVWETDANGKWTEVSADADAS